MVMHLNVLGSRVKTLILGKKNIALAITKQIVVLLLHAQFLQEVLHPQNFLCSLNHNDLLSIYGTMIRISAILIAMRSEERRVGKECRL